MVGWGWCGKGVGIILENVKMVKCGNKISYYMVLSHKDWELPNSRI